MAAPIIYRGVQDVGIPVAHLSEWGPLGPVKALTIDHSAGPRATSKLRARELHQQFDALHAKEFGGRGIGYHFSMDDQGRIYRYAARPSGGALTSATTTRAT